MDAKRRRAISARKTIACLQCLFPSQSRPNTNLVQRGKLIKMCVDMGLAKSSNRFHWCKALRFKFQRKNNHKMIKSSLGINKGRNRCKSVAASTPQKRKNLHGRDLSAESGVGRRVKELRGLVPGGSALGVERLFEETADYIVALEGQVTAMKSVARFFESLELKMDGKTEGCEV